MGLLWLRGGWMGGGKWGGGIAPPSSQCITWWPIVWLIQGVIPLWHLLFTVPFSQSSQKQRCTLGWVPSSLTGIVTRLSMSGRQRATIMATYELTFIYRCLCIELTWHSQIFIAQSSHVGIVPFWSSSSSAYYTGNDTHVPILPPSPLFLRWGDRKSGKDDIDFIIINATMRPRSQQLASLLTWPFSQIIHFL